MVTLTHPGSVLPSIRRISITPPLIGWIGAAGILVALLTVLTLMLADGHVFREDQAILGWVSSWDFAGLSKFFAVVTIATGSKAGLIYGPLGIGLLLLMGKTREAVILGVVGVTIAIIAILGDYTLGSIVSRGRPLAGVGESFKAFPSGHVFGTTVFFGFVAFLAAYYRLNKKLMIPTLTLLASGILLVGPARIYEQAHRPTDVAAGYLLGGLWLLVIIPVFMYLQNAKWLNSPRKKETLMDEDCPSCRTERSIASLVLLNPEKGTATKVYQPSFLVRMIYWLAFQAKFPYVGNQFAFQAAIYRRKVAGILTQHMFGKDLVARVLAVNDTGGKYEFVTEYIPGEKVENDDEAKKYLAQVSDTFSQAGLSVCQINPHNPHAHTNLIRTPQGDLKIIDLESALATPFLAKGQLRSAIKAGNFPVFDDIDFPSMRNYLADNAASLEASLGPNRLAELEHAVGHLEEVIQSWKQSELRLWGRLAKWTYRFFNWKATYTTSKAAVMGADGAAQSFFSAGIERWDREGRLAATETEALKGYLASREVNNAMRHLGVHLVMTAIFPFPIESIMRLAWTLSFWMKLQVARFRHNAGAGPEGGPNIHNPLVMFLSVIPDLGAVAYLASRPLRRKLLVRLLLDQIAWKLPFRLYRRLHLAGLLAPPAKHAIASPLEGLGSNNNPRNVILSPGGIGTKELST